MSAAREEILRRIRAALDDVPDREAAADVPVARDFRHSDECASAELVDLLCERVGDYHADIERAAEAEITAAVDSSPTTTSASSAPIRSSARCPSGSPRWRRRSPIGAFR